MTQDGTKMDACVADKSTPESMMLDILMSTDCFDRTKITEVPVLLLDEDIGAKGHAFALGHLL